MKKTIYILLITYLSYEINGQPTLDEKIAGLFTTTPGTQEKNPGGTPAPKKDCECVPYYLCNKNNSINTNGFGLIDIRQGGDCDSYLEVCCALKDKLSTRINPPAEPAKGCGYRNVDGVRFRIIGDNDNEAQFGEFPWMVAVLAVQYIAGTDKELTIYKCGGTLIHPQAVLTAAHCVYKIDSTFKIRAGEWDTQTENEPLPHQDSFVKNIIIHPDYNNDTLYNDIALFYLETPLTITENVNILCLPPHNVDIPRGTECFATGWGKDIFGAKGKYQVILKKIDLPVVDHKTCQNQLRKTRLGHRFPLHKSFVCAGGVEGKDTCQGDGGSPLMCPIPGEDRYLHYGMVAWGIGCAQREVPGVYVNVGLFRYWIDEQMASLNLDLSAYQ